MSNPLAAFTARAANRLRGLRGNVDGVHDGALRGWAFCPGQPQDRLRVGLFDREGRQLAEARADQPRADLAAAGIGNGHHAFAIPLGPDLLEAVRRSGGQASVRIIGRKALRLGIFAPATIPEPHPPASSGPAISGPATPEPAPAPPPTPRDALARRLYSDLLTLHGAITRLRAAPPDFTPPPLARHRFLFAPTDYINGGTLPAPLGACQDYVRYRNRYDREYDLSDPDTAGREAHHFARYYTDFFNRHRNGLRVPLTRAMIERFNAPVEIDGYRFDMSQIAWSYMAEYPHLRNVMDLRDENWIFAACYWWSIHHAGALNLEDCLVPDRYIDVLAGISTHWDGRPLPLSRFMEQYALESPELSLLDRESDASRRTITLALMVAAIRRPDFLRYLPPESVAQMLAPAEEPAARNSGTKGRVAATVKAATGTGCALSHFARTLLPADAPNPPFDAEDYRKALRLAGFDLDTRRFLSITPEGDRLEAAALPVPQGAPVDIQVIGPFRKASGLGQATRLSLAALEQTGHSLNAVDFGMDNPAPEGFNRVGDLSGIRPARINLIHLNAESVPQAFAYQPDVFSGAWNIGYFFWELDSPASCHFLALDLLDEVWVSTEYGVSIYRPHARIPVTNVGMCVDPPPEVPRDEARAFVADRFGFAPEQFVFFVAFDSFSFVQRKNPLGTLAAFARAFPDDPSVRLVVKTQNRTRVHDPVQRRIWEEADVLIAADPRIVLMDETLSFDDLLRLKRGCDAYVSLHRSEGWGFGMIEAMNLKVPVLCSAYSGNMEFCSDETAWLVRCDEVELAPDDYIFVRPGQKWAEPDIDDAARAMRALRADAPGREARAEAAFARVRTDFSVGAIGARYGARLAEILAALPAAGSGRTEPAAADPGPARKTPRKTTGKKPPAGQKGGVHHTPGT